MPVIKRAIRLTLRAELDDGRIVGVLIPFSVPDGMILVASHPHASLDSKGTKKSEAPTGMAFVHD